MGHAPQTISILGVVWETYSYVHPGGWGGENLVMLNLGGRVGTDDLHLSCVDSTVFLMAKCLTKRPAFKIFSIHVGPSGVW